MRRTTTEQPAALFPRSRPVARVLLAGLLGAFATAGLFASTVTDLQRLTVVPVSAALLLPGLVLIGTLLALAVHDTAPAAIALGISALLGSLGYGLAIAAPGARVEGVRNTLLDRGLTYGLLALMLSLLFGLAGIFVAWLYTAIFRPNQL